MTLVAQLIVIPHRVLHRRTTIKSPLESLYFQCPPSNCRSFYITKPIYKLPQPNPSPVNPNMWGDHDDTDEQNALRKVEDNDGSLSESTPTLMRRPQIAHIDRSLTDSS